jgi:hypothetical protein
MQQFRFKPSNKTHTPYFEGEICSLLRYFAAYSDNSLPTFRNNISFPFSRVRKSKTLEDGPLGWPETSVRNNHYTPRISQKSADLLYFVAVAWNHTSSFATLCLQTFTKLSKTRRSSSWFMVVFSSEHQEYSHNLLYPTLLSECTHIPVVTTTSFGRRTVNYALWHLLGL